MIRPLAVFDVDGTLLDSRRSIAEAMAMAFAGLGLPPPDYEATRQIVGLSLEPAIAQLAPDLPAGRYPDLAEQYRQAFIANRAAGLVEPLYDGASPLLADLKAQGWLLGIATGKSRQGVERFLDAHALRALFDVAFCADDGPGKPDPHMLRLNMTAVDANPEATIMIGDTSFDMAMARGAGAYAQGVSWGFHRVEEIVEGGAHHVAEDFAALHAALAGWRAS
jgi:phosphoglycolate phosphatase